MRSPALALGWQLGRRNGVVLAMVVIFGIATAVIVRLFPAAFQAQGPEDAPRLCREIRLRLGYL